MGRRWLAGLKEYLGAALVPLLAFAGGLTTTVTNLFPKAQPALGLALIAAGALGTLAAVVIVVRSGKARRRAELKAALVEYPPKPIGKYNRHELGIDKSNVVSKAVNGDGQPYIPRDVDTELDDAIRDHRFVVVRGPSKAGKSRTAFEAILRSGDPLLFAARKGAPVADISANCEMFPAGPAVVWLDKLDGYVRAGRFDTSIRDKLLNREKLSIVGTIEDSAWNLIVNADGEAKVTYEGGEVLKSAKAIWLGRASQAELNRANELYPEESFEASIGGHFVAARALRDRYLAGTAEQRAVIRAVVDWQRTGMQRPIPKRALEKLHVHYLGGAEANGLLEEGIAWANQADGSGARLLSSSGWPTPHYTAPDHIVEWLTQSDPEKIVDQAWALVVEHAELDEAMAIGARALELHEREDLDPERAKAAFEHALDLSKPNTRARRVAATRLAMLMRRLGHDALAADYFEVAIESGSMVSGNNYGYMLMQHDEYEKAKPILAQAVGLGSRTAAFNLLQTLAELDAISEAESLLGPEVEKNPAAALMLANVRHCDDLDEADRLYGLVDQSQDDRDDEFRRRAKVLRALIAEERGQHDEAERLFRDGRAPDEWALIAERLDHVGLTEKLARLRTQIADRL